MAETPLNLERIKGLPLDPAVRELISYRFPVETVLLASIAVSLHKIAEEMVEENILERNKQYAPSQS